MARVEEANTGRKLVLFGRVPSAGCLADVFNDEECSTLTLEASHEELESALQSFESGPVIVSPQLLRIWWASSVEELEFTQIERDIARLVVQGSTNREIANNLG